MTMLKQEALVDDGQYALPFDAQAPKSKLVSEALLVHRLEQPGPNMPMHFDARRDELIRTILKSSRLPAFLFHAPRRRRSARVAANWSVEGLFDVGLA